MEKETQKRPVRQEFCKLGQGEQQGWAWPSRVVASRSPAAGPRHLWPECVICAPGLRGWKRFVL